MPKSLDKAIVFARKVDDLVPLSSGAFRDPKGDDDIAEPAIAAIEPR